MGRIMEAISPRGEGASLQLPPDSLFAGGWQGPAGAVADVPEDVKAKIREEAVFTMFHRLETSLRLLLHATTPGKEPPTAESLRQILNVWRYELEHRVHLVADTYCGAIRRYQPTMEDSYVIDGRCRPGDLLRVRVPCWRMRDRVVIRGEAEILSEEEAREWAAEAEARRRAEMEAREFDPYAATSAVVEAVAERAPMMYPATEEAPEPEPFRGGEDAIAALTSPSASERRLGASPEHPLEAELEAALRRAAETQHLKES